MRLSIRPLMMRALRWPSDVALAFGVSLIWLIFYNVRFWQQTIAAMWQPTFGASAFLVSVFVLVLTLQALLLLLSPTRWLMRAVASALFIVASLSSWFTQTYGAIMNKDMLRNVIETDAAEVSGLLNPYLLAHVLIFGILPAVLVWKVRLPERPWSTQLRQRALVSIGALAISVVGLFGCSADYAVYLREYKPIRFTLSPAAPVSSAMELIAQASNGSESRPLENPAGASRHAAPLGRKPFVLFVVVGETARAANFELGGYGRATNSALSRIHNLVYFSNATSCGTSTAVSVPCMFSHLDREHFDVDEANRYANLLDALAGAGIDVEWRENNAGCKGVCKRVPTITYAAQRDGALCQNSYCYDEIMLTDLGERLQHVSRDTVIVFHQIGSHGPAYSERYPGRFEVFKPACRNHELQHCTPQEVINAYDNTIAYTDYLLARQIELLERFSDHLDGALIYASDHGESLGEQGVFLHGLPYAFAPDAQKKVPMLAWVSSGYAERADLDVECLRQRASKPVSHDNLYHTILGVAETRNSAYSSDLDLTARCRGQLHLDHE